MANYYDKFKAKISFQTSSGMKGTAECLSTTGLLSEAVAMAFRAHGEAYVKELFAKELATQVQFKKQFDDEQNKKRGLTP